MKIKVCQNCQNTYIEGDKYCRYCGAPMGTPQYINDDFAEIYGPPPMKRTHKCKKCGEIRRNRAAHEAEVQPDDKRLLIRLTAGKMQ